MADLISCTGMTGRWGLLSRAQNLRGIPPTVDTAGTDLPVGGVGCPQLRLGGSMLGVGGCPVSESEDSRGESCRND